MDDSTSDKLFCADCLSDTYLQQEVVSDGMAGVCEYCGEEGQCITVGWLADEMERVLTESYSFSSAEPEGLDYLLAKEGRWERPGEDVEFLVGDLTGADSDLASDVQSVLSDRYAYDAARNGEENPYDSDAQYVEKSVEIWEIQQSWEFFKASIRGHSRHFNRIAAEVLNELFGDLDSLYTVENLCVVRRFGEEGQPLTIYRARVAFSPVELQEILARPHLELSAPPSRHAKGGRMNATGIPVFYAALDANTCLAEARAPVGGHVVIGRFELIRGLRLLDLDRLSDVYIEGSLFDPDHLVRLRRATFLRNLVSEIARPVMPRDEGFEYLPTQVMADYLSQSIDPAIDGIIFGSSQTGGNGRNIVLFNHAAGLEKPDIPASMKYIVSLGWRTEDDFDDSITVFETVPSSRTTSDEPAGQRMLGVPFLFEESDVDTPDEWDVMRPTLRLDMDSIQVRDIVAVNYDVKERDVSRHRTNEDDHSDF